MHPIMVLKPDLVKVRSSLHDGRLNRKIRFVSLHAVMCPIMGLNPDLVKVRRPSLSCTTKTSFPTAMVLAPILNSCLKCCAVRPFLLPKMLYTLLT